MPGSSCQALRNYIRNATDCQMCSVCVIASKSAVCVATKCLCARPPGHGIEPGGRSPQCQIGRALPRTSLDRDIDLKPMVSLEPGYLATNFQTLLSQTHCIRREWGSRDSPRFDPRPRAPTSLRPLDRCESRAREARRTCCRSGADSLPGHRRANRWSNALSAASVPSPQQSRSVVRHGRAVTSSEHTSTLVWPLASIISPKRAELDRSLEELGIGRATDLQNTLPAELRAQAWRRGLCISGR